MDIAEIKKLANLSRIDIKDDEALGLAKDFDSILAYVDQIKEVSSDFRYKDDMNDNREQYFMYNVVRLDEVTNQKNSQTKDILRNAPQTEDGFIKVKQIL